jgi:hypothetical protein
MAEQVAPELYDAAPLFFDDEPVNGALEVDVAHILPRIRQIIGRIPITAAENIMNDICPAIDAVVEKCRINMESARNELLVSSVWHHLYEWITEIEHFLTLKIQWNFENRDTQRHVRAY